MSPGWTVYLMCSTELLESVLSNGSRCGKSLLRSLGLESRATVARLPDRGTEASMSPVWTVYLMFSDRAIGKVYPTDRAAGKRVASVPRLGKPSNSCSVSPDRGTEASMSPVVDCLSNVFRPRLLESVLSNGSRCREEFASVPRLGSRATVCSVFQTEGPKRRCPRCGLSI